MDYKKYLRVDEKANKMKLAKKKVAFEKIVKTIKSLKNADQADGAIKMINTFAKRYGGEVELMLQEIGKLVAGNHVNWAGKTGKLLDMVNNKLDQIEHEMEVASKK